MVLKCVWIGYDFAMIRVTSTRVTTAGSGAHHYRLAGQPVVFESRVAALDAYCIGPASEPFNELLSHVGECEVLTDNNATVAYQGFAPIDQQQREVTLRRSAHRAQVDLDGVPVCQIDFNEGHLHLLGDQSFDERANLEVVTGPALVLLLTQADVYCLHAGCVATSVGNIAIIAESGSGKSTLSNDAGTLWQQVSDDILPVGFSGDSSTCPLLLPDFPQLKLDRAEVKSRPKVGMSLDYLLRLSPQPAKEIEFVELGRKEAMLEVVRHTVAAKLFDSERLRKHAEFARRISREVPVLEMRYPRKKKQLPELRMRLVDAFANINSRASNHE